MKNEQNKYEHVKVRIVEEIMDNLNKDYINNLTPEQATTLKDNIMGASMNIFNKTVNKLEKTKNIKNKRRVSNKLAKKSRKANRSK